MEPNKLKELVRKIWNTKGHEIGCEDCLEQLDAFVDLTLAGKDTQMMMPLVQQHLDQCDDCREAFEILLEAIKAA